MELNSVIVKGIGGFLPEKRFSNDDFSESLNTSHEWIYERTGIEARRIAASHETTSILAVKACEVALKDAGIKADEIDLIICATATPDKTFPATAVLIQHALGVSQGFAFDIQAVCSGFVYALTLANNFLKLGQAKKALVIGADVSSRILDWSDRTTCVLFGDGAGAMVVEAISPKQNTQNRGILSTSLYSDGKFSSLLETTGGVSTTGTAGTILMQGREVYRHAVEKMTKGIQEALEKNNLTISDIDWLVPHQANKRIMIAVAERLGIPPEKLIITLGEHANTFAATIPLALWETQKKNLIKEGDLIVLEALGGGLTWGSVVLRW
ncbi:MAG: ketoacyl-ACP synthase III [Proteobacteria bacterium]|nr:ketoacyl-ACP synthase III [Pseudomonadota bacterium]